MSTHKIGFYEDLTKLSLNHHQISSNTHLISSAAGACLIQVRRYCYVTIENQCTDCTRQIACLINT